MQYFVEPKISRNFGYRHLSDLPFPATTICSPIFSRDPVNLNLTKFLYEYTEDNPGNFTVEQQNILAANTQWCNTKYVLEVLNASKERTEHDIIKVMKKTQMTLDEFMFGCQYRRENFDCSKLFTRVLTHLGFCFTYNMQDFYELFHKVIADDFKSYERDEKSEEIEWDIDDGFLKDSDEVYPRRATWAEELVVYLKVNINCNVD